MPCHVRSASKLKIRRSPSQFPPRDAVLRLDKPADRRVHDLVRRFCTGRWPLWSLLGVYGGPDALRCAVKWLRGGPGTFSVVEITPDGLALRWWYYPTADAACTALPAKTTADAVVGGTQQ